MLTTMPSPPAFQLVFQSTYREGRGYSFPCDGRGQVRLDDLSDRARANYLYARAMMGREFLWPELRLCA